MRLIGAVLVLFGLMGCQQKIQAPSVPQEIHLNLKNEPTTLDPRKGGDIISSHMHFLLFEGLVRLNADHSLSLAQANAFTLSEDELTYTFTLRDTFWSNGLPVTAHDFETSWKTILDPAFPSVNAHLLYVIKNAEAAKRGLLPLNDVGIHAQDDKTLVVTLEKPTPYFLELISFCVFFPVCSAVDAQAPHWAYQAGAQFVSNGPFVLKEWKHNASLIAEKNTLYWDKDKTRPERICFSMIDNETTALHLFEQGALDMVGDPLCPLPVEAVPSLREKWPVHRMPIGATTLLSFNVDRAPFNHKKIRQALSYAIDRNSLVKNILHTEGEVALNAVPPILKGGRNHPFFHDADLEKAKVLLQEGLAELGLTKEVFSGLTFLYPLSDKNHKIAQALQQQWKEHLDIRIRIEGLELKVLLDKLSKREYGVAQALWAAQYNDPMNILERFKYKTNVKNYPNWEHSDYISLLERSFYVKGQDRQALLEEAEALFLEEMPICPLYHWDMTYLIQPRLVDVQVSPIGDLVFNALNVQQR